MTQSQIHILVVDDERNIRKNLTMVLEAAGYMVDAASDGEEAIAKCKERHPDIASSISRCSRWMASKYLATSAL